MTTRFNKNKTRISPEAILSVAEVLFSKKGYKGTSLTDISKKLRVTKPALYYHFKNKMEILDSLYLKTVEELSSSFAGVTLNARTPVIHCLSYSRGLNAT